MKTYNYLYPQIYAFENLYRAYHKARRGGKRKKESVAGGRWRCGVTDGETTAPTCYGWGSVASRLWRRNLLTSMQSCYIR